jgi:hypothetical protein
MFASRRKEPPPSAHRFNSFWDIALGDFEPKFVLRNFTAPQMASLRDETFQRIPELEVSWRGEFEESKGIQNFLTATGNYPTLAGQKTNLYKRFLPRGWSNMSPQGVVALLHPEGVYEDPDGGAFRREMYVRLRGHYQFVNELSSSLFADVDHHAKFSINVFGPVRAEPAFIHIANLFLPRTLDASLIHSGIGPVPGIKEETEDFDGRITTTWNTEGHLARLVHVQITELALFAKLYGDSTTPPLEARLPAIHAKPLLAVLQKFADQSSRIGDLGDSQIYLNATHWNERNAQADGTIRRDTQFPESAGAWILSGPHFFVGNPFYKTPREHCSHNSHYDALDLEVLPDNYLPRTNFVPNTDADTYAARTPRVAWTEPGAVEPRRITDYFRVAASRGLSTGGERTLQGCIIPADVMHIHGVFSATLRNETWIPACAGMWSSLPFDFFVKATGRGDFTNDLAKQLPIPESLLESEPLAARVLALCCLTSHYAPLWNRLWQDSFRDQQWAVSRTTLYAGTAALPREHFEGLVPNWRRSCALRNDYARRQALVEIDVTRRACPRADTSRNC